MSDHPIATVAVHVGQPSPKFQEWARTTLYFHGFVGLSRPLASSRFTCFDHQWIVWLFPRGRNDAEEGMVSVALYCFSDERVKIIYDIRVKNFKDEFVGGAGIQTANFPSYVNTPRGLCENFMRRSKMMKSLVDGTLVIEVLMKLADPAKVNPPPFIPENPSACKLIQSMFMDEESSDVAFEVGGHRVKDNAEKVARTAPAAFHAHRFILRKCSTALADLLGSGGEGMVPIQIDNVSPAVFRLLLNYIYGGRVSDEDMREHTKEIIDAADRFGVTNLKLEAEARFVQATTFSVENVMEHLLYSESKNCALLKEAVMDFIVENKDEVLEKISFNEVIAPGTLIRDVLAAVARGEKKGEKDVSREKNQFSTMRISDLRRKVHEQGLDVDGSREMLIAALRKHP